MEKETWNRIISQFPLSTFLQTWEWGQLKSKYGWDQDFYIKRNEKGEVIAATLILVREQRITRFGPSVKVVYLPHGPLMNWNNEEISGIVLDDLISYAKRAKAVFLKLDPQIILESEIGRILSNRVVASPKIQNWLAQKNWLFSKQQIQFKNTFWIDLSPTADEILSGMKQKTRYNVRLAEKRGISVKMGGMDDLELLYQMYAETSVRDGFIIRPKDYYLCLWKTFIEAGIALPLIANYQNTPVAAIILFSFNKKSYYLNGMSRDLHREKMPNYLLQWEAIKLSKNLGNEIYDLWGAPDSSNENDRMWGVYRFKDGLGGKIIKTLGAYDYPISKFTYNIIQEGLPLIQKLTRSIRSSQLRSEIFSG